MKSVTEGLFALVMAVVVVAALASCGSKLGPDASSSPASKDTMRMAVLKRAAVANGFLPANELQIETDPTRVKVGRLIFESRLMSINGSISCRDCHLDEFGSADGLPNAIGVGGIGKGASRMNSGGHILPRNTLPFWGRGGKGFDTFFWDGKVTKKAGKVVSQYGDQPPSDDPLVVAIHLPSVELREMVADTPKIRKSVVSEDVSVAETIQNELASRLVREKAIGPLLAKAYGKDAADLRFAQVGDALAQFIRHEFRIQPTRFERFVWGDEAITRKELAGGILFYGRGRCSSCHSGPYFSDLDFHAVPFPQAGFGKNGFGVDEGRYNVTLDPRDRFLFRTPPLYNVTRTAPYSHSGSVMSLEGAIIAHFDPLRFVVPSKMTPRERSDFYGRLGPASRETLPSMLTDEEVSELVAFLSMLEFDNSSR